jgi:uncharacterized protein
MKFVLDDSLDGHLVQHYAEGEIRISGVVYTRNLVIQPDRIMPHWRPDTFEDLRQEDFAQLVASDPEVIILGTGKKQQFPALALTRPLMEARIGVEIMDTAAACRTYNILMSERRRVTAALMMIRS